EGLGDDPDAVIARQVDFFTGRGQSAEWKTYGYDEPADLPERLTAYGFVAEDEEALVLGEAEHLAQPVAISSRYAVRAASGDDEWEQVGRLDEAVFGEGSSRFA